MSILSKFTRYDFDSDGLISKEDIHLLLSHIPMSVSYKLFKLAENRLLIKLR